MKALIAIGTAAFVALGALATPLRAAEQPADTADPIPEAEEGDFNLVTVAAPLANPWSVAFLPDGRPIVTERPGRLNIVEGVGGKITPVSGVPEVFVAGHGGLLDVHLDPQFEKNKTLYLSYTWGHRAASTLRVARAKLDGDKLTNVEVIYESWPPLPGIENFGGRITIDKDNYLFLSVGDRFDLSKPQDLGSSWGKIIRIKTDGAIPTDNPFVGVPGARKEIWAYGVRNPQGLTFDPDTGKLWEIEHGPQGGDELNIIEPGRNYGWPVITYGIGYDNKPIGIGTEAKGMEQPIYYWKPSIATSGLAIYKTGPFPQWKNTIWVGGLASEILDQLKMNGERVAQEHRFLEGEIGRIRDVRVGPEGFLYLTTDLEDGGLYRIEPKANPGEQSSENDTPATDAAAPAK